MHHIIQHHDLRWQALKQKFKKFTSLSILSLNLDPVYTLKWGQFPVQATLSNSLAYMLGQIYP